MPKLTDTQLVILSAATIRADNSILPLPKKIKLAKAATNSFLEGLVKKKLAEAQPATPGAPVWRSDKAGQPMMLVISEAGLQALVAGSADSLPAAGADTRVASSSKNRSRKETGPIPPQKPVRQRTSRKAGKAEKSKGRSGSKQAKVVDLLRRASGASIEEMMKATGWQAHSVRGVISGALKKKRGLAIISEKSKAGDRRYRIAE
jgi:Protein of unknown function (DUF3489)